MLSNASSVDIHTEQQLKQLPINRRADEQRTATSTHMEPPLLCMSEAEADAADAATTAAMLAQPSGVPGFAAAVYDAAITLSGTTTASRMRSLSSPPTDDTKPSSIAAAGGASNDNDDNDATATDADATASMRVKRRRVRSKDAASPSAHTKRRISFQHKWLSKYALRITSMDAVTSEVLVLACRLCEKYGREKPAVDSTEVNADTDSKPRRRVTSNVKHFKPPWRSDNIAHHAKSQHAQRFAAYDALTAKQKEAFLEYTGPPQTANVSSSSSSSTLAALPLPQQQPLTSAMASGLRVADASSAVGTPSDLIRGPLLPLYPGTGNDSSKITYHNTNSNSNSSLATTSTTTSNRVVWLIDAPIVDTVLADVLLDNDSELGALVHDRAQARAIFTQSSSAGAGAYSVTIPHRRDPARCLQFVAAGASLRMVTRLMADAPRAHRFNSSAVESPAAVVGFVRMAIAMNLQVLATILQQSWAFSLVLDARSLAAADTDTPSYIDVRVRVTLPMTYALRDIHILALPATETDRYTSQFVFDSLSKLLTAVDSSWTHKLVGVVTRGSPQATAPLRNVVTRLLASTTDGCYNVASSAEVLDAALERLARQLFDDAFVHDIAALSSFVRSDRELLDALDGYTSLPPPSFVATSWRAMTRLIDWFATTRVIGKRHLDAKRPQCAPSLRWWVLMAALKRFRDIVEAARGKLAGLTAQRAQQRACLDGLVHELMAVANIRRLDESHGTAVATASASGQQFVFGPYYATHRGIEALLDDLEPFVFELVETLRQRDASAYSAVVATVAFVFGETVRDLANAIAERDRQSVGATDSVNALDALPSVLPHELVRLSGATLNRLLRTQQLRLLARFPPDEPSAIHHEHAQLKAAYASDATFKAQVDAMTPAMSFERAWSSVGALFPKLRRFCAGLATAFPVDDDDDNVNQRVVAYERTDTQASLVDFELEAMLHARQFSALQTIAMRGGL